jgi:hypothetical protein
MIEKVFSQVGHLTRVIGFAHPEIGWQWRDLTPKRSL